MKNTRRQELQTNVLAQQLGTFLKQYGRRLKVGALVVGIVVLLWGGFKWRQSSTQAAEAAVWEKFMAISVEAEIGKTTGEDALGASTTLEREIQAYTSVATEYEVLAEENKGATAEAWIRAAAANAHLSVGMRQLYIDRGEAELSFSTAKSLYEDLASNEAQYDPELRDRIRYGLAQSCEGLSFVEPDPGRHRQLMDLAKDGYRSLEENATSGGIQRLAEYRRRILTPIAAKGWSATDSSPDRGDWSSWLAQQDLPEPPAPPESGGLNPGGGPITDPSGGPALNPSALPSPLTPPAAEQPQKSGEGEASDSDAADEDPTEKDSSDPPSEKTPDADKKPNSNENAEKAEATPAASAKPPEKQK